MSWTPLTVAIPTSSALGLDGPISMVQIDPFGAGGHELSFPNAVDRLIKCLGDLPDNPVMAVAVSAANLGEFVENIGLLSAAVPMKPFKQMLRHASALANLETSKWALPQTVIRSASLALNSMPAIAALEAAELLQDAAQAAEDFKTSNPLTNLTALVSEKAAHAAQVASALSSAQSGLAGGAGWRFYAESGVAAALKIGHPQHDQIYTGILAFSAPSGDLQLLTELFA